MTDSLSSDNYSFEGFSPSDLPEKMPPQDLAHQARSLYKETNKLIDQLHNAAPEDITTLLATYRELKKIKGKARQLEQSITGHELQSGLGKEDLMQCAHNQAEQALNRASEELETIQTELLPKASFRRFLQGDPKSLLYIKSETSNQYFVLGNRENLQKLMASGKITKEQVSRAIGRGEFGILNLQEKVCSSCTKEKTIDKLISHPGLIEVNKRAHSSIESMLLSDIEEFTSSKDLGASIIQELEQDLESAIHEIEGALESLELTKEEVVQQLGEIVEERREKEEEKKETGKKKSYGATMRSRDNLQDAIAAKKKRERLEDERINTKLKQRRDDDQRIETREDTNIRKDQRTPPQNN